MTGINHHHHHHHHHHHSPSPDIPFPAHHLYKSRHETTHPGQLRDTTTAPSQAPDSQCDNANQTGSKTRGTRWDTEGTGQTEGQAAGRTRCARLFLYSIFFYSLILPYLQLPFHQNTKNTCLITCFSCSMASFPTLPPKHEECDQTVAFSCLGPFPPPSTIQTPDMQTRPQCHVFVSGCPSTLYHPSPRHPLDPDTKIATTWSRSSCLGYSPLPSLSVPLTALEFPL